MMTFRLFLIAAGTVATAAAAQRPALPTAPSALLSAIDACRTERDDRKRLACFDEAASALAKTDSSKLVVIDREDVKKTRRSLFGFTLPKMPFFSGDNSQEEEEQAEIDTVIRSVRSDGNKKFTLVMEDGSVWRTTEAMSDTPKPDDTARIKRGALGSYMLKIPRFRAARAMRVK